MNNWLEKWRGGEDKGLSPERRLMKEALARLDRVRTDSTPPPQMARLAFVLDLTGSRSASLQKARIATAAMFDTIRAIGSVAVKMIYFRGARECKASAWESDPAVVSRTMQQLSCATGATQIGRALRQVLIESETPAAVVFIGDHCEDDPRELVALSAELGKRNAPLYVFHECGDDDARSLAAQPVFTRVAEASGGVYCEFRPDAGDVLRELLSSVAAFSSAGKEGVTQIGRAATPQARQLQDRLLLGDGSNDSKRK